MKISTWEDDDAMMMMMMMMMTTMTMTMMMMMMMMMMMNNGMQMVYLAAVQSHILEPSQRCQQGSRSSKLHGLRKGVWPDAFDAIH